MADPPSGTEPRSELDRSSGSGAAGRGPDSLLSRMVIVVSIVAAAGLLLLLFVLGIKILLATFGGILIAVLLHAFSAPLARSTFLSYRWALAVVVVAILGILGAGGWLLAPQIAEQADQLGRQLPVALGGIEQYLQQQGWGRLILDQAQRGVLPSVEENGSEALSTISQWSYYFLVAIFVGLFGAASPRLYTEGAVRLVPLRHRARVRDLIVALGHTLRWWLIGQGLAMLLIGVSTMILLWAFGIPLAIVLGLIVGLLGFIPYLGPIIGAVPVALIAATQGPLLLLYVMLAYTGVQMLEGYVATPLIQHRMVYLPPAFTIASQILLGSVLGIIGFVLATPLAAVALVLSRFYRADILGDEEARERIARRLRDADDSAARVV